MKKVNLSRRKFISNTAFASLAFPLDAIGFSSTQKSRIKKPNSKVGGVQIGLSTYSYLKVPHSAEEVLGYLLDAGVNSIEMRSVLEEDMGIPQAPPKPAPGVSERELNEYRKAINGLKEAQRKWRLILPLQKYADIRKRYNDAGVNIHIAKFAPSTWSNEEIDYAFKAAGILGAYGITDEIGEDACKILGKFAEKHKSLAIFHQHGQPVDPDWSFDKFLAYSSSNMLNFDVAHYYGATGIHPNVIIEKYHHRMKSIHIHDMTGPKSNPPNTDVIIGQGETPISDVLLLLKKEKWPINVDLELVKIPENSDAVKEVTRCIEYMKAILD